MLPKPYSKCVFFTQVPQNENSTLYTYIFVMLSLKITFNFL